MNNMLKKKRDIDILFFFTLTLFIIAKIMKNFYFLYGIVLIMWGLCLVICALNFRKHVPLFFFLIMIFLFILGKPLASIGIKVNFWNRANENQILFALTLLGLSLIGIYFGISSQFSKEISIESNNTINSFWLTLQQTSYYVFLLSLFLNMFQGLYQILFFRSHTYLDYYNGTYTTDNLPFIVKIGTQMLVPSMAVCLATKPNMHRGKRVLILYIISTLPMLIMGSRGPSMSALIFYIVYCILRDKTDKQLTLDGEQAQWFKLKNLILVFMASPIVMGLLVVYTEIRNGIIIKSRIIEKISHPISWFLYELGQSFDLLLSFANIKDTLPPGKFPGYFFGYLYDCLFYNQIVSRLLGIHTYTAYTKEWLEASRSIAPYLSYYVLGETSFLAGNNTDSVFIIDAFSSFGYVGVFVTSLLLAVYLLNIEKIMNKNWLLSTFAIYSLLAVFQLPRSMFMSMFGFIVSPYFWITIILIYIVSNLYYHHY